MSHPNPTTRTSPDKPGFVRVTNDRGHGGIRTRPISRKDAANMLLFKAAPALLEAARIGRRALEALRPFSAEEAEGFEACIATLGAAIRQAQGEEQS